jgi:hypothetical protein
MNVLSFDPGLSGAWAVGDLHGALLACFPIPTIGEGVQRRVDAANLADAIREYGAYAFAIVEQVSARPGQGVSSMFRFGQTDWSRNRPTRRFRSWSASARPPAPATWRGPAHVSGLCGLRS